MINFSQYFIQKFATSLVSNGSVPKREEKKGALTEV